MGRKTRSKKDSQIDFLDEVLNNNGHAITEYKDNKYTAHDLKDIKALTDNQRLMIESYINGNIIIASGSAGTGKSYLSLYLALSDIFNKGSPRNKIIIVRSATQTKDLGFLPGTKDEKLEPYELPYKDICADLLGKKTAYDRLKQNEKIVFMSTSLLRGLTWDNAVIIIDEAQSMTLHELDTTITRIGKNSNLIICGDLAQNDLIYKKYETSGFAAILKIFKNISNVEIINFTEHDIVRSNFIKQYIIAKQNLKI